MAPTGTKRVLVLLMTLLGTAHAAAGDACAADGSSAAYTETISMAQGVTKRTIVTNGCPNHESYCTGKPANKPTCKEEGEQGDGTEATDQAIQQDVNEALDIPAVLADSEKLATATEGEARSIVPWAPSRTR